MAPTAILEALPEAVVAARPDGRIVFVNSLAEQLFGYDRAELIGELVASLWPERVRARYTANMKLYFAIEHPMRFTSEAFGRRRDGSEFVGEMSWGIVETTSGPLLLAIGRDVTLQRAAQAREQAVAAMAERALAGAEMGALAAEAVDLIRRTLPVAGAAVRLASGVELASHGVRDGATIVLPIGVGDELLVAPSRELAGDELSHVRAIASTLAIAIARLRDEEGVRHRAVHDPLTGLANRTLLSAQLAKALARSAREGTTTGVLFVDLDDFKSINDDYGHATGDSVLAELGARLRSGVRPTDTVARLGGDEFVVVCEDIDEQSALSLSERVLEAIRVPLTLGTVVHHLSASIGVALGYSDADALLDRADAACYRAKSAGRARTELAR